jgi:chromosome segregation ATPase
VDDRALELGMARAKMDGMRGEAECLREEVRQRGTDLDALRGKYGAAKGRTSAACMQARELQAQLDARGETLQALQAMLAAREADVASLEAQWQAAEAQAASSAARACTQAAVREVQAEAARAEALRLAEAQWQAVGADNKALRAACARLRERLVEAEVDHAQAVERARALEGRLEEVDRHPPQAGGPQISWRLVP